MSDSKVFNPVEKEKLKNVMNEGIRVLTEIQVLTEGLNDTLKSIAQEMDIKQSVLKKAVKTAHKRNFHEATADYELLENILISAGKDV